MSSADFEDTPFEEVFFVAPHAVSMATVARVQMTRSGRNKDDLLRESGQRHDRTERGGQRGRSASSVGKEPIVTCASRLCSTCNVVCVSPNRSRSKLERFAHGSTFP